MKHFVDGDQLVVVRDDFVDLQESPAIFMPCGNKMAQAIQQSGFEALSVADRLGLKSELLAQGYAMEYRALVNREETPKSAASTVDAGFMEFEEWKQHDGNQ